MIEIETARGSHFNLFQPKAVFTGELFSKEPLQFVVDQKIGFSYSYFAKGEILGCVGGHILWRGVAEVWAWLGDAIKKYPVEFTKKIINCLDFHKERLDIHRYQLYVREGEVQAERWARVLGFKTEGIMQKYGMDGTNYIMMGRV